MTKTNKVVLFIIVAWFVVFGSFEILHKYEGTSKTYSFTFLQENQ